MGYSASSVFEEPLSSEIRIAAAVPFMAMNAERKMIPITDRSGYLNFIIVLSMKANKVSLDGSPSVIDSDMISTVAPTITDKT